MRTILHVIGGRATLRPGATRSPVHDASTGQVQATVEHGDAALLAEAVTVAKAAQPAWAAVNPQHRAPVMFKFKQLIEENLELAGRSDTAVG
jgi:malonate-semialdehyde dehydrogenase (acetylating)/methylmalonate-semialdehyde dehydrogenase